MGRNPRQWNPNLYYHVVMRGNNRQDIIRDREDVLELIRILYYTYEKYPFRISAYCFMTNHYHLLIQSPEVPLGKVMGMINRRYSNYYKKKYDYSGYLYESRYYADLLIGPESVLAVSRYIHRNPISTKIPLVSSMELYPYSSFAFYKHSKPSKHPFLQLDHLLSLLPSSSKTNEAYCRYCEGDLDIKLR